MLGKILQLSFLLAAAMAVTLSVSVMGTGFPGPSKAHDGGADSPSPAEHDIMRKGWFIRGKPGSSHWPDGTLDYRIDTSMMPQAWESEIRTAVREMADGTFIDAITYNPESQNLIGMTNAALRRTCGIGSLACARPKTSSGVYGGYDAHFNSFNIWLNNKPSHKIGLIGNNCDIPDTRKIERDARTYLELIVKHELGHVLGHQGHSADNHSNNPDSDLMGG